MESALLYAARQGQPSKRKKKRIRPREKTQRNHTLSTAKEDEESFMTSDDDDDVSVVAMHALKRLKVNDDTVNDEGDIETDDEKSSITSISSADSTPPHPPPPRPPTEFLPMDDYPPTPKHNNRSSNPARRRFAITLPDLTQTAQTQQPMYMMNAYLGRLHQDRRQPQQPQYLVRGMDALSIDTSSNRSEDEHVRDVAAVSDLFLPALSAPSSPTSSPGQQRKWRVQLHTDSKLE